jgi:hypothetical protein
MWLLTALVLTVLIYIKETSSAIPIVWISYVIGI